MLGKSRLEDVLMLVVERPVSFTDFEPRGVPGFMSNIAHVFGCSENQTNRLLEAVDTLADDHHYRVDRVSVPGARGSSDEETHPSKFQVTVSPA